MTLSKSLFLACLAIVALHTSTARAADWNVPGDSATLQGAVDAAASGDRILVAPGTYRESVIVSAKALDFVATGGPAVTAIDGEGVRQIFYFSDCGGGLIEGFTLVNGYASQGGAIGTYRSNITVRNCTLQGNHASYGGAVSGYYASTISLQDSRVIGNTADSLGGGAYGNVGGVIATRTLFQGNRAAYGGAMATGSWCGSATAELSVVVDNIATMDGGAFFGAGGGESCRSRVTVSGSLVTGNVAAGVGGAIVSLNASVEMVASTIVGNSATAGGALYASTTTPFRLRSSILWDNGEGSIVGGPTYQVQQYPPWPGYNDIVGSLVPADAPTGFPGDASTRTGDPRFVDAAARNYRLLPDSPAINAAPFYTEWPATPVVDLDGVQRPIGVAAEMGAYEFVPDQDADGFTVLQDCDDLDPTVYPGAPETRFDGIDQDCNGYDLTIDITSAIWSKSKRTLTLIATSSLGAQAKLVVANYGLAMTWNAKKVWWTASKPGLSVSPATVTVTGPEGSWTKKVTVAR